MSNVLTETRPGWTTDCPKCGKLIKFSRLRSPSRIQPFFYSVDGTEILCRRSDSEFIDEVAVQYDRSGKLIPTNVLENLYDQILKAAPTTKSGSKFELWAYVRCPFCNYEFEYRGGVRNLDLRLTETEMIVIDGIFIVDDEERRKVVVNTEQDD